MISPLQYIRSFYAGWTSMLRDDVSVQVLPWYRLLIKVPVFTKDYLKGWLSV